MADMTPDDSAASGQLSANIAHFARALRRAGVPVGPGHVILAIEAVVAAGFTCRDDFRHVLRSCLTSRPEHLVIFDQVFRLFWRDPRYHEHMMAMLLPSIRGVAPRPVSRAAERRAAEALVDGHEIERPAVRKDDDFAESYEVDAALTWSASETIREKDFEQMTVAEQDEARRAIATIDLSVRPIVCRRARVHASGPLPDRRETMRRCVRMAGELETIARRRQIRRWPDLVALCDISGSMSAYSRMFLHFLHAAGTASGRGWGRVFGFTFGTRLTNISRHLAASDPDDALAAVGCHALDWEGGTRIGSCLREFNRDWSRRILGRGAVVLLITDGLDRGEFETLSAEAERLRLSCRELIWMNPLLRWEGFQPLAQGTKALMLHAHRLVAGHNVKSLESLAQVLNTSRTSTMTVASVPAPSPDGGFRRASHPTANSNWGSGASVSGF